DNLVGTDLSGTTATGTDGLPLGNAADGVLVTNAAHNNIGGNVVSGNIRNGVHISGTASVGNQVVGNPIGTNAARANPLGNSNDGVLVDAGASGNYVGDGFPVDSNHNVSGPNNVISGNVKAGIEITQASGNFVQGNFIGTDGSGARATDNN